MRMQGGHRMSAGMQQDVEEARAYAKGVLSPLTMEAVADMFHTRWLNSEPNRHEWKNVTLALGNGSESDAKAAIEAAVDAIMQRRGFELQHRRNRGNSDGWDIEIIGEMPEQIGMCRYSPLGEGRKLASKTALEIGTAIHKAVLEGAHMFPILNPATNKPELKEPTVGKWYCGFDDDDRDGLICQYVGDGEFQDDDGGSFDMGCYDYLVEQNGRAAEVIKRMQENRA